MFSSYLLWLSVDYACKTVNSVFGYIFTTFAGILWREYFILGTDNHSTWHFGRLIVRSPSFNRPKICVACLCRMRHLLVIHATLACDACVTCYRHNVCDCPAISLAKRKIFFTPAIIFYCTEEKTLFHSVKCKTVCLLCSIASYSPILM